MIKFLKYQFQTQYRALIFNGLTFFISIFSFANSDILRESKFNTLGLHLLVGIVLFAAEIYFFIKINKIMTSDLYNPKGYFVYTLPISVYKINLSKIIFTMIYTIIMIAVSIASIMLTFANDIRRAIDLVMHEFSSIGIHLVVEGILIPITAILFFITLNLLLTTVIKVMFNNNRLTKYSILLTIIVYLYIVPNYILRAISISPLSINLFFIIFSIACYFGASYILDKYLDL